MKTDPSAVDGFLAAPAAGSGPTVILLPAWWGLNGYFRSLCTRLAGEGFVTFGVDYYGGEVAATVEEARRLRASLDRQSLKRRLNRLVDELQARVEGSAAGIGVIGFSLGAGLAVDLARTRPVEVAALVLFYGTGGGNCAGVHAAVQGHYAEYDSWRAGPEQANAFRNRLAGVGVEADFHFYPGTEHWFCEEDRPDAYHPQAANLAWERTVQFLNRELRSDQPGGSSGDG
jgi:carboxymethylenebutenolidase